MTRRCALGLCLFVLIALPPACNGGGGGEDRGFMSFGTAPPGGAFFQVGGALVEALNQAGRGWKITAEATSGSQENIRRLARGELDFALSNSAITYHAVRGSEGWDQAYPVRSVMTLAPNVALFIAPRSSGITTIHDLRGKRVVIGPAGAGFEFFVKPLLEAHGMSYDDFTPLNATQAAAVDMLADGSAAAAFIGGAVPTASITQAAATQAIVFIPYEEAAMARLVAEYPFFSRATIPANTYPGQTEDFHSLDTGSMHLIAAASAEEQLVYEITKALYENRERVVQGHPAGRSINAGNVVRNLGTEFHPGAIRYYREIGIWQD